MSYRIEEHWYRSSMTWLTLLLLPFSWIFRVVVFLRKLFYKICQKKLKEFSVPVIVVGNITVGGTGKTPFVIALAEKLLTENYYPGIVTRGAGGKKHTKPVRVTQHSDPKEVGDEAILLARRSRCPVYICIDRVKAVEQLLQENSCNIIISDDGLQHYRLKRNIEIVMLDGQRGIGNGKMLPAGPLREPLSRLKQIHYKVTQSASVPGHYRMDLVGDDAISLQDQTNTKPLSDFSVKRIHAVAAIGNPSRFFAMLHQKGFNVVEHVFPDHYLYAAKDFQFQDDRLIFMTEKDAVKCTQFANEKFWYIPVIAKINGDCFTHILSELTKE